MSNSKHVSWLYFRMVTITTTRMTPTQILPEGVELGISKLVCEVIRAKQNNFCYYSPPPRGGGGGGSFWKDICQKLCEMARNFSGNKMLQKLQSSPPTRKKYKKLSPPYSLLSFIFEKIKVSKFVWNGEKFYLRKLIWVEDLKVKRRKHIRFLYSSFSLWIQRSSFFP